MLDPSTLVPAVDALERKGLAMRGQDPNDRRRNPLWGVAE
jgi:DNA-binding MarR family transcriptional regulator